MASTEYAFSLPAPAIGSRGFAMVYFLPTVTDTTVKFSVTTDSSANDYTVTASVSIYLKVGNQQHPLFFFWSLLPPTCFCKFQIFGFKLKNMTRFFDLTLVLPWTHFPTHTLSPSPLDGWRPGEETCARRTDPGRAGHTWFETCLMPTKVAYMRGIRESWSKRKDNQRQQACWHNRSDGAVVARRIMRFRDVGPIPSRDKAVLPTSAWICMDFPNRVRGLS